MDHYAADTSAVVEHLDLKNAVHIGHSTGGGQADQGAKVARGGGSGAEDGGEAFNRKPPRAELGCNERLTQEEHQVVPKLGMKGHVIRRPYPW